MSDRSLITYVRSSSVRAEIVGALCATRRETEDLLDSLDASESAVYDALSALERRGVVASADGGWRLTGVGRLVGDRLDRQRATEELLAESPEYWQQHDTSVLPKRFRRRLPELGDYEVVRGTTTDLDRVVRAVVKRVESVESCDIVSPVYHKSYSDAMPDNEDSRLLLSCDVVDTVLTEMPEEKRPRYRETAVRVAPVPYALGVSDEWVMLTLPEHSGDWPDAKLVSEAPTALQWGEQLFETLWADAEPMASYVAAE